MSHPTYIIASDIHGSAYYCGKLMQVMEQEQPDKLLLLGDLLYHGPRNDLPRDYAPKKVIAMLNEHIKNLAVFQIVQLGKRNPELDAS